MKNLSTNESTSFESTLGSPTKPSQNFGFQKPRQIFLVNSGKETMSGDMENPIPLPPLPDLQPKKKKILKIKKPENRIKPVKNKVVKSIHILDFDAIFRNIILQKKKIIIKKTNNKKSIKKNNKPRNKLNLISVKRIRDSQSQTLSIKSKFFYIIII